MNRTAVSLMLIGLLGPLPALAQAPAGPAPRSTMPAKPAPGSPAAVYGAMPEAERIAIQTDLIWTGDYNGLADGVFSERAVAAVKAWQKRAGGKETGLLNPDERGRLVQSARTVRQRVGWKTADDVMTGARLGLPEKLVPQAYSGPGMTGMRWQSGHGEIQIETFKVSGATLAAVFDQQKKQPPARKTEYSVMKGDFFVVSGLQGLKKFYVRGHVKDQEVRGVTILYDQAMEGTMDVVTVAMSSAFQPFPVAAAGVPAPRRAVEYASAVAVGRDALVTDLRAVDSCRVVVVPGHGNAEVVKADLDGLALLRLWGATGLRPGVLGPGASGDTILVGVADPDAQGGGGSVSTVTARLAGGASGFGVTPSPPPGFSGAAALGADGRLIGVIAAGSQQVAGPGAGQSTVVPAETIASVLKANGVEPTSDAAAPPARPTVVRVICVRN